MGNAGNVVDRYGFSLSNDGTAHTRHTLHNSLRDRIIYFMRLGSSTVSTEPKDLFLSATGTSMIPDIAYQEEEGPNSGGPRLLDIKTLGGGTKQYTCTTSGNLRKGAHVREKAVPKEYRARARRYDREGDPNLTENQKGPLERTLEYHGGAIGLCFGFYAEASPEVHKLVGILADKWLEQEMAGTFDFSGNQDQAKARMVRLIRKNLGLTCAFGWASHKIHALHKLNRRRGHQLHMAEEIDRELQLDENPAILYSQGQGGVGTE